MHDDSAEQPFDAIAETVNDQTADALELLGNETRLAIIVALWDAIDPTAWADEADPGLSFSELRDRVGVQDSGQFNYHLSKLTDRLVDQTDGNYTLVQSARRILSSIIAGGVTDPPSFADEPIDADCYRCGGPTAIDYDDNILTWRCTSCEGAFQLSDGPRGVLARFHRPPVALANRTPNEFHRHGNAWHRHRIHSVYDGVCPDCSGAVSSTLYHCENHDAQADTVCEHCGMLWEIQGRFACDICKSSWRLAGWGPMAQELAVLRFWDEHGLNPFALYDEAEWSVYHDALEMTVRTEEPLEVAATLELDGDRLDVIINNEAQVIDVIEEPQDTD